MKAAFVAAFLASDAAARFFMGKCPKPEAMETVDVEKYAGMWYGQETDYMFTFSMLPSSCDFKKFTMNEQGNLDLWFGANSSLFGEMGVNGELFCYKQKIVHGGDETCEANMANKNSHKPFAILATDYENYDVGYYCMELLPKWLPLPIQISTDIATIYTRDKVIDEETLNTARDIIQDKVPEYDWNASRMRSTSQDRCEYNEVAWKWGEWKIMKYMKEAKNIIKTLIW